MSIRFMKMAKASVVLSDYRTNSTMNRRIATNDSYLYLSGDIYVSIEPFNQESNQFKIIVVNGCKQWRPAGCHLGVDIDTQFNQQAQYIDAFACHSCHSRCVHSPLI
jgi:hypothetical protein